MTIQNRMIVGIRGLGWALLLVFSTAAWSTTYYVDATGGSDTNNGTASTRAWKTLSKVNATAFVAGDSILLRRGQTWRERLTITASGTSASPITFDAYGTGVSPIINGADLITGWTLSSTNVYTASVSTEPEVVAFNGVKGTRVASASAVTAAGTWSWVSGVLTIYSASTPSNVEASQRQFAVQLNSNSYVNLRNLAIRFAEDPVRALDTVHVSIENLIIVDSAGYGGIILCAVTSGRGTDNKVQGCDISNMSGSTDSSASGGNGIGIFLWGQSLCARSTITGNTVHGNGGIGILISDSSSNTVSSNVVWGQGDIGISLCGLTSDANVVEKNQVYGNCQTQNDRFGINFYMPGNNNLVRYNTVHDQHVLTDAEVGIPNFTERSGGIRFDGDTYIGVTNKTGNRIYENIVYNEYDGIQIFNYSNVQASNNTVYNSVRAGIHISCAVVAGSSNGNVCFANAVSQAQQKLVWNDNATNTSFDYNVYYPNGSSAFNYNGTSRNLAGWKSLSGSDVHAVAGDPLFSDVATPDFHLQAGSACIDVAAQTAAGETDFAGVTRPQGTASDAGAYEYAVAPTASFTASPVSGSAPLTVQFTDTSSPGTSAITAWAWDFDGDGMVDSTAQNPSFIYTTEGKYTVSLTVLNGAGSNTVTQTELINITSGPSADFTASPTSGLAPLTVTFTDASAAGGSTIIAWAWDFNDDGVIDSTAQNPQYTFTAGTYTVSLTVHTQDGRSDTRVRSSYITVETGPTAEFTADLTSGYTPLTVQFTDASIAGTRAITAWDWNFGDGSSHSALEAPSHTYTTAGTYTVSLTVTTAAGSSTRTRTNYIAVQQGVGPTAAFSADTTTGESPVTVQFTDASAAGTSPITAWAWNFGDGASSTEQSPSHTYGTAGIYSVTLTVTTLVGPDSEVKLGYITVIRTQAPTAAFSNTPSMGTAPLSVQFTDSSDPGSKPITAWHWDFGDGTESSQASPVHVYTVAGVFPVSLTITTGIGSNTVSSAKPITVFTAVFVDKDNASGVEDGTSWSTAYTHLQDGIAMAASAGVSEVWAAEGRYNETRSDGNGALVLHENVRCYGGFAGTESARDDRDWTSHATIIDGTSARTGSAAYHVVVGANNAVLDGFTITGGLANNGNLSRDRGAGLYNSGVSPTIAHCTFSGNTALYAGGAIFNTGGAAPALHACVFNGNSAQASYTTQGLGGAIYNDASSPAIVNCVFIGNTAKASLLADGYGGAVYNKNAAPVIMNCSFTSNRTYGALFSNGSGGAVYSNGGSPVLTNSVLWGDSPNEMGTQNSASPVVTYCDVQGGYSGTGNKNTDPKYTSASSGNLILLSTSPCIDAGTLAGAPSEDLAGVGRPQGSGIDLGAYEYGVKPQAAFSASVTAGLAPLSVTFTDQSVAGTSPITSWAWDFGDAQSGTAQNPTHVYSTPGLYTVNLTIQTFAGSSSAAPVTVTVAAPLSVTLSPAEDKVYVGDSIMLIANAAGGLGTRYFEWRVGDELVNSEKLDENSNTLILTDTTTSAAGVYWCQVSDDSGASLSSSATIHVFTHLSISEQPVGAQTEAGGSHTFHVATTGGMPPIGFNWKRNGQALSEAVDASLLLENLSGADAGIYTVEVFDSGSDLLESAPAALTVHESVPALGMGGLILLAASLAFASARRRRPAH